MNPALTMFGKTNTPVAFSPSRRAALFLAYRTFNTRLASRSSSCRVAASPSAGITAAAIAASSSAIPIALVRLIVSILLLHGLSGQSYFTAHRRSRSPTHRLHNTIVIGSRTGEKVPDNRSPDIARTTLQLLALGLLIATSFWIVRPFLVALTWATMIAVATWPLLLEAQAWLGGRRALAVALLTITLLLILVVPLYFGVSAIVDNTEEIVRRSKSLATYAVPQPPAWLAGLPLVGTKLAGVWQQLAATAPE